MDRAPFMAETPIDLYRSGNASSANMHEVRLKPPSEVEVHTDIRYELWVKALSGGVSTWDAPDPTWSGKAWKAQAGSPVPAGLTVWTDGGGHWLWGPAADMRLGLLPGAGGRKRLVFQGLSSGRRWMILFSAKARRVLDDAVGLLPDAQQRAQWRRWSADHPQVRQPGGPTDDGAGPLPHDIAAIALAALEAKALRLRADRSGAVEDEVFALDNDLSLLRSIEAMLVEARNTVHA